MFEHQPGARGRALARRAARVAAAALLSVAATGVASAVEETPPSGISYYVDCAQGSDTAAGTSTATAWRTLSRANAQWLAGGDSVNIKGGTACAGTLQPQGDGQPGHPVVIRSYGTGKARIDGGGALAAVYLHNVQYYTVRNLEITNTGAGTAQRVGVYLRLDDFGTGHTYTISDLLIHDVNGHDFRYPNPSGGIIVEAGGTVTPTGFAGVTIARNTLRHVDRSGIATFSSWQKRTQMPNGPGSTFAPMTGLRITDNVLSDIGGDGSSVSNGVDAVVERNKVDGYNLRSADYNLGIFAWNSDRTVIQRNEVAHGAFAFGVEGGTTDTKLQYNYSHDNPGGLLYVCASNYPGEGPVTTGAKIRYNVSRNDGGGPYGLIATTCTALSGIEIYNNTLYSPTAPVFTFVGSDTTALRFRNNLFVGRPEGATLEDSTSTYANNLFYTLAAGEPPGAAPVLGNPLLAAPGGTGPDGLKLSAGSPAIAAGTPIDPAGTCDYWGQPVPSGAPNIGADQAR